MNFVLLLFLLEIGNIVIQHPAILPRFCLPLLEPDLDTFSPYEPLTMHGPLPFRVFKRDKYSAKETERLKSTRN